MSKLFEFLKQVLANLFYIANNALKNNGNLLNKLVLISSLNLTILIQ